MRVPPHRQEGPRRRRGAKEALPRVRPQLPGVDGAGARRHQAARGDLGALRRGDARGRYAARRRRVRRLAQDQLLDAPPPLRGDGVDAAGLRGGPGLPGGGRRDARARLAFGQPLEVGGFSMPRPRTPARGRRGRYRRELGQGQRAHHGQREGRRDGRGGLLRQDGGRRRPARAPLNRVNALHSALKAFLARFRGVSTRRLPNYLAWFCWAREARRGGDAASLLRAQMGPGTYRTSWRGLWRHPYPFHPEISMS